ncbi:hypothetical protein [Shouchella lonarensis]|uniref:Uncharacterized protein n=1 Tax=Shouchella lonarensis TaxID=1464122 RepID=A0A1G6HLJ7_9BACI|nr:hypothetical protein [Shouchella lonarensis]SDB95177.1 hypothetical protein SAMN05421737_10466 [Shouchella lonarensis]
MDFEREIRELRDKINKEAGFGAIYIRSDNLDKQAKKEKWFVYGATVVLFLISLFWFVPFLKEAFNNLSSSFPEVSNFLLVLFLLSMLLFPLVVVINFIRDFVNNAYNDVELKKGEKEKRDEGWRTEFINFLLSLKKRKFFKWRVLYYPLVYVIALLRYILFYGNPPVANLRFRFSKDVFDEWVKDKGLSSEDIKGCVLPCVETEIKEEEKRSWRTFLDKLIPAIVVGFSIAMLSMLFNGAMLQFNSAFTVATMPNQEEALDFWEEATGKKITREELISKLDITENLIEATKSGFVIIIAGAITGKALHWFVFELRRGAKVNGMLLAKRAIYSYLKENSSKYGKTG